MRYRLYEIDRLISRTVSWAVITGVLVAVFAGAVVALQAVVRRRHPGRDVGGRGVHARRVRAAPADAPAGPDGRGPSLRPPRYDAQRTVDAFAEQVRNEVDLTRLRGALVATAQDAVRPVDRDCLVARSRRGCPVTALAARDRPGALSIVLVAASIVSSVAISLAMDRRAGSLLDQPLVETFVGAALFNVTCVLQSAGRRHHRVAAPGSRDRPASLVERSALRAPRRRLGHGRRAGIARRPAGLPRRQLGRSAPFVSGRGPHRRLGAAAVPDRDAAGTPLAAPGRSAPGPVRLRHGRVGGAAHLHGAVDRPRTSPIGIESWPSFLQPFVDAIPLELLAAHCTGRRGIDHPLPARRPDRAPPDPLVRRRSGGLPGRLRRGPGGVRDPHGRRLAHLRARRLRRHPRDAHRDRDRGHPVSPLRDRSADQPHDRLGARHGRAARRGSPRPSSASRPSSPASRRGRPWPWPAPRCSPSRCSSLCAGGSRPPSTGASTGRATTATEPLRHSPSACETQVDLAGARGRHHRRRSDRRSTRSRSTSGSAARARTTP